MSDIVKDSGNVYRLLPNRYKEEGSAAYTYVNRSQELTRQAYGSHTFYVLNPNGTQVTIQASPGYDQWYDLAPASADAQFVVHSVRNCSLVRVLTDRTEGNEDQDLQVVVVSGGLAHL
jgi:hypothetical protein